jgi:uncharacterized protein (DUF488 family)
MAKGTMFTIGHSTHSTEDFLRLLKKHSISVVADVRSSPFSRFNPQFNRSSLKEDLKENGIKYVFLGSELGARSDDPKCYQNGKVIYSRLAETTVFREGINRLLTGVEDHRIALMCSEKEPLDCHRTLLVTQVLSRHGITVSHIHADGNLEAHTCALERLVEKVGLPQEDLFRSKEDLISEALVQQEARIAYEDENQERVVSEARQ